MSVEVVTGRRPARWSVVATCDDCGGRAGARAVVVFDGTDGARLSGDAAAAIACSDACADVVMRANTEVDPIAWVRVPFARFPANLARNARADGAGGPWGRRTTPLPDEAAGGDAGAAANKSAAPLPKTDRGAVCAQWVRCGKPACRCAAGALHGPYPYLFWREDGRLRKRYVRAAEAVNVGAAVAERRRVARQERAERVGAWAAWRAARDAVRGAERRA